MDTNQGRKAIGGFQRGFSLLELLLSMAILCIVAGVVVDGLASLQQRNIGEVNRVDLTQETRQFQDQILRDLRQAGFPSIAMFDPSTLTSSTNCALDNNVACGLISVSSTAIQFEGDIDGSGVSEVYIQLVQPAGGCPCTLQRGTVLKSVGGTPTYYTELNYVMNTSVFTAYDYQGNSISLPASASNLPNIKNIGITLYVQSPFPDPGRPGAPYYPDITMVSEAKINN
jgi:prepilin-type N-terminal cleavage/methylation domain-containing protein